MKQILCFGDSNTWGLMPAARGRYDYDVRWTGLLQKKIGFEKAHIIEEGLVGRTTVFPDTYRNRRFREAELLLPLILEMRAPLDAIVLMLGTNDCKTEYHASAEEITAGLAKLIGMIKEQAPESRLLIVSPLHLGDHVWEPQFDPEFDPRSVEVSHELKEHYAKLAQEVGAEFLAASDYAEPSLIDREHLTPEGHAVLAQAIYEKLCLMGF